MKNQPECTRHIGIRWIAAIVLYLTLHAADLTANDDMFYVSVSGGYAKQSFDVAEHSALDTTDSTFTIAIGWDISDRFTLEHHWYHLGTYRFREDEPTSPFSYPPRGDVNGLGAAALFYILGSGGADGISNRQGLNLYAKVAATLVDGDLWFGNPEVLEDEINGWHAGLGFGIEYGLQPLNLAFRGAVETLGDDLVFGSVSIMWRWGRAN